MVVYIYIEIEKLEREDSISPVLVIGSTHFSQQTNQMKLNLNSEQLKQIGQWLINESEKTKKWISGSPPVEGIEFYEYDKD